MRVLVRLLIFFFFFVKSPTAYFNGHIWSSRDSMSLFARVWCPLLLIVDVLKWFYSLCSWLYYHWFIYSCQFGFWSLEPMSVHNKSLDWSLYLFKSKLNVLSIFFFSMQTKICPWLIISFLGSLDRSSNI